MIEMFQSLVASAPSHAVEALILLLMPFFREDVAIVVAGLMIAEQRMPTALAAGSVYAGIVASDFALFGLGRLARRSGALRRFLLRPRIEKAVSWLRSNVVTAMIVARIVPGVISPVYIGCGLTGVRVALFGAVTLLTSAVYTGVLLVIVVEVGETALSGMGYWGVLLALSVLVVGTAVMARRPPWGLLLRTGRTELKDLIARARAHAEVPFLSHRGMPSLQGMDVRIGAAERIPSKLFYIPLALQWLGLAIRYRSISLPTLVNPLIEVGGLWGESKQVYLDMVSGDARDWLARYVTLDRASDDPSVDGRRALELVRAAGFDLPFVAKPDIGWQGYGVRPLQSEEAFMAYVAEFPKGARMMVQEMVPWEGEAGIFYVRMPGEEHGRVLALTLRYFPHVIGDGHGKVRDLILADERAYWKAGLHLGLGSGHAGLSEAVLDQVPAAGEVVRLAFIGSIRVGGLYRNADDQITPALDARIEAISRSMPEFYYGRYDVRFASIEQLCAGEDFRIIEINGAGSEAISAWDPETPVREVYARLLRQQRLMFQIGAANRDRGWKVPGPGPILRAAWRQRRLVGRYPPSS